MRRSTTFLIIGLISLLVWGCFDPSTGPKSSASAFRVSDHRPLDPWLKGRDPAVPFQEIWRSFHDVYETPVILVVTSAAEWRDDHQKALEQGALTLTPPPSPPSGVNWDREALLVVGMRDVGGAYAVRIAGLARYGLRLRADVEIDWSRRLDAIEYSPSVIVKFKRWPGLAGSCRIGPEQVADGLQRLRQGGI